MNFTCNANIMEWMYQRYEYSQILHFFNVDQKYNRARLSHLRTIKKKALEEYNAIANDLWSCTEAEFVQNLTCQFDVFLIILIKLIICCQFDTL